jgi:hypothetical protein
MTDHTTSVDTSSVDTSSVDTSSVDTSSVDTSSVDSVVRRHRHRAGRSGENVADRVAHAGLSAAIVEQDLVGAECSTTSARCSHPSQSAGSSAYVRSWSPARGLKIGGRALATLGPPVGAWRSYVRSWRCGPVPASIQLGRNRSSHGWPGARRSIAIWSQVLSRGPRTGSAVSKSMRSFGRGDAAL